MLSLSEAQAEPCGGSGVHVGGEVGARLGTAQQRIHRRQIAVHQIFMKSIFVISVGYSSV